MKAGQALREEVLEANLGLKRYALVTLTWGNASAIDRDRGLVAIKPSGVPYEDMRVDDIVLLDLDGQMVDGSRHPSTDTPTHLLLYRSFSEIGGVVHTHSTWATAWAQAGRAIPILGTTHADLCPGPVPITRSLTDEEVRGEYERNTGFVLCETIVEHGIEVTPAALVPGHGPFTWGSSVSEALERAVTLEEIARMALLSIAIDAGLEPIGHSIIDRHFSRKHGPGAYYGQPG